MFLVIDIEERSIDLPLAGGVQLAIVRTQPGAHRSMEVLEDVVRFAESYMSEPFPTNLVLLLFADAVMDDAAGHNVGINMTVHPDFDRNDGSEDALYAPVVLAHEVAHYYWGISASEPWIDEGAAEVMAYEYDEVATGYHWEVPDIANAYPCPVAHLSDLKRLLEYERPGDCVYGLGAGLFLDLLRSLGAEDFKKGFRDLYRLRQNDPGAVEYGIRRIDVRKAFEFHPEARDVVIPKWYGD